MADTFSTSSRSQPPILSAQVDAATKSVGVVLSEPPQIDTIDKSSSQHVSNDRHQKQKLPSGVTATKTTYLTLYRDASIFDLLVLLISLVCAAASGAALPLMTVIFGRLGELFQDLFNGTIDPRSFDDQLRIFALYFVYLAAAEWVVAYVSTVGSMYFGERITGKIRENYLRAILRQNVGYFDELGAGEITTRITADCNLIQDGVSQKVALVMRGIATFVTAFIIGFVKSWKLTLVIAGAIAAIGLTMSLGSTYAMKVNQHSIQAYAEGGTVAEEAISSIRNAAAFGTQAKLAGQYNKHLQEAGKWGLKMKKIMGVMWSVVMCFMFLSYALGFWVGGRFVADGSSSLSDVLTTLMALMTGAISLGQMGPWVQAFSTATAAAAKIFSSIERQSPIDIDSSTGLVPERVRGNVELKNVTHVYPSRPDVVVMKEFNLYIPAGKTTALVGASGSGKSTIVSLIERFYEPVRGEIFLDGHDIQDLNLRWLRQQISLVQQEPVLFATTIFENIRQGLTGTKYEDAEEQTIRKLIVDSAKKANAHDFISALEEGYQTHVGSRGFLLSGGQKQRIAIARAIVSDPCILLLDEATSALDTKSELVVQEALEKASRGRTTITIAHRLSTIKNADNIVVMANGQIAEQGTHEQLLLHKSVYHRLVQAQQLEEAVESTEIEMDESSLQPTRTKESRKLSRVDTHPETIVGRLKVSERYLTRYSLWVLIKFTASFNKAEWHLLLFGLICSVIGGGGNPLQAVFFAKEISALSLPPSRYSELKSETSFWALMFVMLAVTQLLAFVGQGVLFAICSEKLIHRVRAQAFQAMLRQDISFFDKAENTAGTLTSFLSTETTQLAGLSGTTLGTILTALTSLFASVILAIAVGWKLGLVCSACIPVLIASGFFRFWLLARFEQRAKRAYEASASYACEAASAIRTVASLTRERAIWQQYHQQIVNQEHKSLRSIAKTSVLFACSQSFVSLVNALGFWYGGTLLENGEYSIFQFFVTFTAILFGTEGAGVVFAFAPDMAKAREAASDLKALLERPVLIDSKSSRGERMESMAGNVEFKNIEFRYPTRPTQLVLRNINLTVKANQYVALVGASGCGKSTTLALLERFYDPSSGTVLVDGKDISTLNVSEYRRHLAIVSQEPTLYQGTVRDNILMGVDYDDVSEEELMRACKAANAYDFVMSLPDGFGTTCGPKGTLLSGGQKQRIAIARALIRNPKILLLDEATSALDSESEKIVQAALDNAAKGRTTIAVAHRLSTIQRADMIYVFDAGHIVERGTHDELLRKQGKYHELVTLQKLD